MSSPRLTPIMEEKEEDLVEGRVGHGPSPLIINNYFGEFFLDNSTATSPLESVSPIIAKPVRVQRPALKAVVLDNDETTGSYGLVFSVLSNIRTIGIVDEGAVRILYQRLAAVLVKRRLFRPHLGPLLQCLTFLRDEGALDSVIMYTNQNEEVPFNPYNAFWKIMYNIPYSISYLMYEAYKTNAFDDILSRPTYLHGINHAACPKSFSRIFNLDPDRPRDTKDILFVDDNACPQFITAPPRTSVDPASYYRIGAYVRVLTDEELEEALKEILEGFTNSSTMSEGFVVEETVRDAIKKSYRKYAPLERIALHKDDDDAMLVLRRKILEKYIA